MKHIRNTIRVLLFTFSLLVGFDGIIMSYLSSANSPDAVHQTANVSLCSASHHSHEEDTALSEFVPKSGAVLSLCSKVTPLILVSHCNYSACIWQPPKTV